MANDKPTMCTDNHSGKSPAMHRVGAAAFGIIIGIIIPIIKGMTFYYIPVCTTQEWWAPVPEQALWVVLSRKQ